MKRSGHHVLVSVPTRGSIHWQTVQSLEALRDDTPGLRSILYQEGNLSVALTRNKIVKRFLETDCEVLVMVDDDIVVPPHLMQSIVPRIPEFAMVSIPHPMPAADNSTLVLSAFKANVFGHLNLAELEPGLNEVDAVATGCVAISREALEALGPHPFRIEHDPDADITSDDFLFCADLRAAGYRIGCWWDGWYCDHIRAVQLAPLMEARLHSTSRSLA